MTVLEPTDVRPRDDAAGDPATADRPEAPSTRDRDLPRAAERYGVIAVGAACLLVGWAFRWTADDAFINFRAIDNFLAGNGMVFNAGQRIEVTTSPLWAYLLAFASMVLPVSLPWLSVIGGVLLSTAGVVLGCLGCVRLRRGSRPTGVLVPFGAVIFLALPPVWDFLTSGLETGLAFGWLGLCWWGLASVAVGDPARRRPVWLMVAIGLGPLIRPDLAVVTVALASYAVWSGSQSRFRRVGDLALGAALPVGYEIFRMGYYGLLVPNTAVAKESTRALWERGFGYLTDFFGPYHLWIPGLVVVAVISWGLWVLREQQRVVVLVSVFLAAAAVHMIFVVRVGGDFMHARMLLPGTMMALLPVFLFPVTRRGFEVSLAFLTVVGVWAALAMSHLRVDYPAGMDESGIADERGWYARVAQDANPVTVADHGAQSLVPYSDRVTALQERGEDVLVAQRWEAGPDTAVLELAPSRDGVVFLVGNAGIYGDAAGLDVTVVDFFGLAEPVASHMAPPVPGRPGHEKQIPLPYLIALYGADDGTSVPAHEIAAFPFYPPVVAEQVRAAREVLRCGEVAELLAATNDELTWERFRDNLTGAVGRTDLRIPYDAVEARDAVC
jgi:arabinofuranosyltransferase